MAVVIDLPQANVASLRIVAGQLRAGILALSGAGSLPAIALPFGEPRALCVVLGQEKLRLEMLLGRRGGIAPLAVVDDFASIPQPLAQLVSLRITAAALREVVLALTRRLGA